jgi:sensor histidine kinase YesM
MEDYTNLHKDNLKTNADQKASILALQMRPHFIYNTLTSIYYLCDEDTEKAKSTILAFTSYMRKNFTALSSEDTIPFKDELEHAKAYLEVEKTRFDDEIEIEYDIPYTDFNLPPLTLQPLVENAIRHGIHKRGKTGGTVTLRTKKTDNAWIIEVEDDGVGFNVDQIHEEIRQKKRSSTGLKNIRFRIKAVLNGSLNITSKEGEGTVVTVSIPRT